MPSPMTPPPTMATAHLDLGGPSVGTISPRAAGFMVAPRAHCSSARQVGSLHSPPGRENPSPPFARSFVFSAREDAERRRLHRRARGERLHRRLVAAVGDRAQAAGVHHALLALARPGAEAGVALDLLDRLVAER